MDITLIAAMDRQRVIGINNTLPWHLPNDFKHFKALTMGKPIIMGRKTYASIGRPLPHRRNIVLSRDAKFSAPGIDVFHDLQSALASCQQEPEVMIIGGATLYTLALPIATKLELTIVDTEVKGDTWFPEYATNDWQETKHEPHPADDCHAFSYTFVTLKRLESPNPTLSSPST